jgi:ribosomal protein S8
MTDAAYLKSLRNAEKQVASTKTAYESAQKAYDNSSIKKYGFWRHLENWRKLRKLKGILRTDQNTLSVLLEYEKDQKRVDLTD